MFGKFDSDIIYEYTTCVSFFLDDLGSTEELLYDEINMIISLDVTAQDDVAFIHFLNLKRDTEERYGERTMPIRNNMDMTEQDYTEFLSTYGFFLSDFKKWLNNDYLAWGLRFPYNPEEFYTTLNFKE